MTDHTDHTDHPHHTPEGMFLMTPEQAAVFSESTRRDIMVLLAERPATTQQLAEAMGKPKGTVGHHLKVLEEAGLLAVVDTRQVRAITEKYYGRLARTYVFPQVEGTGEDHGFVVEALGEMRALQEGESGFFTLRHARIPAERADEFGDALLALAEEFATAARGGTTVYGLIAGIYPTDRPSLKGDRP